MTKLILLLFVFFFFALACRESPKMPRPHAYPRIEYPDKKYVVYDSSDCPFTFGFPAYAEIKTRDEACWFDLFMPVFKARIHCSYLPIKNREEYDDLVQDAFAIADRINGRANYMEDSRIQNDHGIQGVLLEWSGPAASPVHFFLTDTTHHFFKAALYFDAKVQPDSLAPIVEFIKKDIDYMISTFNWRKE